METMKKRSKFLLFLTSLLPGGGYMYLNMMQLGLFLMLLFFGLGMVAIFLGEMFLVFLPVVWFYSFFDTYHMAKLSVEERKEKEAVVMKKVSQIAQTGAPKLEKNKKRIIGIGAMLIGIFAFLYKILLPISYDILPMITNNNPSEQNFMIYNIMIGGLHRLPTLVVIFILIGLGRNLMKAEREEITQELSEVPVPIESNIPVKEEKVTLAKKETI